MEFARAGKDGRHAAQLVCRTPQGYLQALCLRDAAASSWLRHSLPHG